MEVSSVGTSHASGWVLLRRPQIHYAELPVADYVRAAVETAVKIHEEDLPGDILIFLTGARIVLVRKQRAHRLSI